MKAYTFLTLFQMYYRYISCKKNCIKCIVRDNEEECIGNRCTNFIKAVLILVEHNKTVFESDFRKSVQNLKCKFKSSIRYYFLFKLVFDLILKLFQKELGDKSVLLHFLNSQNSRIKFAKILDDNICSFEIQRCLKFKHTDNISMENIELLLQNYKIYEVKIIILTSNIIYEANKEGSDEIKSIIGKIINNRASYYTNNILNKADLRKELKIELNNVREIKMMKLDFFTPCSFKKAIDAILGYKKNLVGFNRIHIVFIYDVNLYILSIFETFLKNQIDFSWEGFQIGILNDLEKLVDNMDMFLKFKSDLQSMEVSLYAYHHIFHDESELIVLFECCFKSLLCKIDYIILHRSFRTIIDTFEMFFKSLNNPISHTEADIERVVIYLNEESYRNEYMFDRALLGKSTIFETNFFENVKQYTEDKEENIKFKITRIIEEQ